MQTLTAEDQAQVKAILMTHAEMQDHRTMETETALGLLRHEADGDDEALEMIEDLEESISELTTDSENLKRIASKF